MRKKITVGIIAHVDAGKTTLTEALLYEAGAIRKKGRVDRRDTFLDNAELERERGITIFSKCARMTVGETSAFLLDTPGHTDFSAETERTLSVLDYAVLVISGSEGVQAHTDTLVSLLDRYKIPAFVFVTKMDLAGAERGSVMRELNGALGDAAVDFTLPQSERDEHIALCDDDALSEYAENGAVSDDTAARLIRRRRLYPCYFGSGLSGDGVRQLLDALDRYTIMPSYSDTFSAKVYKIMRDPRGKRLTCMKITGGELSCRETVEYVFRTRQMSEKVTEIRLYSGEKYENADKASAGDIVAVTGLSATYASQSLGTFVPGENASDYSAGNASENEAPSLSPVMSYRIRLPENVSPVTFLPKLRELEEEEPLLGIEWNEKYGEIHAHIMGQVQTEVLERIIADRYGVNAVFDDARIMYRETISSAGEGVGHYEPLRHYAEVHLWLEPMPRGSGITLALSQGDNSLDESTKRLVLTHLAEKTHLGVLTGSPIDDMKITLIGGRAHLEHTEGGDFRQATYRALRQGLMMLREKGACVLCEPYYSVKIILDAELAGRAISDITAMYGTAADSEDNGDGTMTVTGRVPVSTFASYPQTLAAYTGGKGKLFVSGAGYYPCHNTEETVAEIAYDAEGDTENPADSVFCSHGAGVNVSWRDAPLYMHVECVKEKADESEIASKKARRKSESFDERELDAIMEREFGPIRRRVYSEPKKITASQTKERKPRELLYIIDCYNVIFAWDELSAAAEYDLEGARRSLLEILANYRAFTGREIIAVFDAYNVKGAQARKSEYNGVRVVFTKEGEIGDVYIEKLISEIGGDKTVRVVTSDGLIQLRAIRSGVMRISAREFREEVLENDCEIKDFLVKLSEEQKRKPKKQ